ncbi:hypothetical protein [Zoogloea sp.]|uniref:hypothetical protein n=1 Tax=Zoogloea sp. TaxID=49181 RepID=UPI0035B419AD
MTDKLEVAKLATQLTAALIESKQLQDVGTQRVLNTSNEPDAVALFDYLFEHIQARLSREN